MKAEISALILLIMVGCSHPQPKAGPDVTSGADAELFFAVFRDNTNQVSVALQRGANIDARHHGLMAAARLEGATPLYVAVFDNKPALVALLLAHGADPTVGNALGETPLDLAQKRGLAEVVEVLMKASSNRAVRALDGSIKGIEGRREI